MGNTNIGNKPLNRIKIGLPKGSFIKYSNKIIATLIGNCLEEKRLSYQNDLYEVYLVKLRDVPKLLENNIIDVGITCDEWLAETGAKVEVLKKLDWCDTKISLIGCIEIEKMADKKISCITEYPNIAKRYFEAKNIEHSIYTISGSSEAFVPNRFDYCIDCVETQGTLNANKLNEIEVILRSKIVLARSNQSNASIDELLGCIEGLVL